MNFGKRIFVLGCWVVLVVMLYSTQPALAQTESVPLPDAPPSAELNAADIPSEKVNQFVSAYLGIAELIDDRSEDLQQAQTEAESQRLQRAIENRAFDLMQAEGLTRQEYFQLLGLANSDAEFRDRVLAQLEESGR